MIRAGAVADAGRLLDAGLSTRNLAYLTADRLVITPFATAYAVRDRLPFRRKVLHRWLVDHQVGRLEIKRRGLDLDPAVLRRELRPAGPAQATMIISRTPRGAVVAVVEGSPIRREQARSRASAPCPKRDLLLSGLYH